MLWMTGRYYRTRVVLQFGLHANYSSGNGELQLHPRGGISWSPVSPWKVFFRSGLYNYHDFLRLPDLKSQKAAHFITGVKYDVKPFYALFEVFHKEYWDLPALNADGVGVVNEDNGIFNESQYYNTSGTRRTTGFDVALELPERKEGIVNGYLSYTYQFSQGHIDEQLGTSSFGADLNTVPPVGESFRAQHLREHTFSAFIKVKPFIRLQNPLASSDHLPSSGQTSKKPLAHKKGFTKKYLQVLLKQYFSVTASILSERRITPIDDVLVIKDNDGVARFSLLRGEFNSDTLPPIVNISIKYGIPITKNIETFVVFANILDYQNIIDYNYGVTEAAKQRASSTDVNSGDLLGKGAVSRQGVGGGSDLEFTVRGGFYLRF